MENTDNKVDHDLIFRKAEQGDIPFLVDVIINAESGHSNQISYQKVFGFDEEELRDFLSNMLLDETPGHEFTYTSYLIAEFEGKPVGALSGFIEGIEGIASKTIKANLMARYVGLDKWKAAKPSLEKLAQLDIERTPGSLQLEYGYVLPDIKARGVMTGIHRYTMINAKKHHPDLEIAECQSTLDNVALRKLNRIGWVDHQVIKTDDPEIFNFTSCNSRLVRRFYFKDFQGTF